MKIILIKDNFFLGSVGDVLNLKNGFVLNFLIPNNYSIILDKKLILNLIFLKKKIIFNDLILKKYLKIIFKKINFKIFYWSLNIFNNKLYNINLNDVLYFFKLNGFNFYKNKIKFSKIKDFIYYIKIFIYNFYYIKLLLILI